MKMMKILGLGGLSAGGLNGTAQGDAQAVKRMGMKGGCRAWLEFHLSLVYPDKIMNKETFWHPEWCVPARAPREAGWKHRGLGFNPFKLPFLTVPAPTSVQEFCPFTGAVGQVWAGVDLWAAHLAGGSSCLCFLQGVIIFLPNTQTQLG